MNFQSFIASIKYYKEDLDLLASKYPDLLDHFFGKYNINLNQLLSLDFLATLSEDQIADFNRIFTLLTPANKKFEVLQDQSIPPNIFNRLIEFYIYESDRILSNDQYKFLVHEINKNNLDPALIDRIFQSFNHKSQIDRLITPTFLDELTIHQHVLFLKQVYSIFNNAHNICSKTISAIVYSACLKINNSSETNGALKKYYSEIISHILQSRYKELSHHKNYANIINTALGCHHLLTLNQINQIIESVSTTPAFPGVFKDFIETMDSIDDKILFVKLVFRKCKHLFSEIHKFQYFMALIPYDVLNTDEMVKWVIKQNPQILETFKSPTNDQSRNIIFHSFMNKNLDSEHNARQKFIKHGYKSPISFLDNNSTYVFNNITNKLSTILLESDSFTDFTFKMFGISSKKYKKLALSLFKSHANEPNLYLFKSKQAEKVLELEAFVSDINPDIKYTIYEELLNSNNATLLQDFNSIIKCLPLLNKKYIPHILKKVFGEPKFIHSEDQKPLHMGLSYTHKPSDVILFRDTAYMLQSIHNPNELQQKRSIKELHDYIQYIVKIQKFPNTPIVHDDLSLKVHNTSIGIEGSYYGISVPKDRHELLKWGEQLSFCIGTANYTELVNKKQLYIFLIKKNSEPYAAITIHRKDLRLDQANTFRNRPLESIELFSLLQNIREKLSGEQ